MHGDLWGSMKTASLGGRRYFLFFFTTDFSIMSWVYLKFKVFVEKQIEKNLKVSRSDREGEFQSTYFKKYYEKYAMN